MPTYSCVQDGYLLPDFFWRKLFASAVQDHKMTQRMAIWLMTAAQQCKALRPTTPGMRCTINKPASLGSQGGSRCSNHHAALKNAIVTYYPRTPSCRFSSRSMLTLSHLLYSRPAAPLKPPVWQRWYHKAPASQLAVSSLQSKSFPFSGPLSLAT